MDLEVHYLSKAKSKAEERSRELANTVQKQQVIVFTLHIIRVIPVLPKLRKSGCRILPNISLSIVHN